MAHGLVISAQVRVDNASGELFLLPDEYSLLQNSLLSAYRRDLVLLLSVNFDDAVARHQQAVCCPFEKILNQIELTDFVLDEQGSRDIVSPGCGPARLGMDARV